VTTIEAAPPPQGSSDPSEWATLEKPALPAEAPKTAAPEPVRAASEPTRPSAAAAAPTPAGPTVAEAPQAKALAPVVPDIEREALARASKALVQGRCETELPGLAELLETSERADTKARARILRARCFTQRAKADQAKAEYLAYVHDYPTGAWAAEARGAVGAP
jgi:hypothetical protein